MQSFGSTLTAYPFWASLEPIRDGLHEETIVEGAGEFGAFQYDECTHGGTFTYGTQCKVEAGKFLQFRSCIYSKRSGVLTRIEFQHLRGLLMV